MQPLALGIPVVSPLFRARFGGFSLKVFVAVPARSANPRSGIPGGCGSHAEHAAAHHSRENAGWASQRPSVLAGPMFVCCCAGQAKVNGATHGLSMRCDVQYALERAILGPDASTVRARVILLILAKRCEQEAPAGSPIEALPAHFLRQMAKLVCVTRVPAKWAPCLFREHILASDQMWPQLHVNHEAALSAKIAELEAEEEEFPSDEREREIIDEATAQWPEVWRSIAPSFFDGPRNYLGWALLNMYDRAPNGVIEKNESGAIVPEALSLFGGEYIKRIAPLDCIMPGWPDLDDKFIERLVPNHREFCSCTGELKTPHGLDMGSCERCHVYLDSLLAVDWDVDAGLFTRSGSPHTAEIIDWTALEDEDRRKMQCAKERKENDEENEGDLEFWEPPLSHFIAAAPGARRMVEPAGTAETTAKDAAARQYGATRRDIFGECDDLAPNPNLSSS